MTQEQVLREIEHLVECWCDRRALRPLRYILNAYPLSSGLTDEWGQLLDALKSIKAQSRTDLRNEELEKVSELIISVNNIVYR